MKSSFLSVRNLSKCFKNTEGSHTVLVNANLELNQGETVAISGDSGSGKSTLLNIIAGLEPPSEGEVNFRGYSLWLKSESERSLIRKNQMALVFQQFNLIPSLTIAENISFHAKLVGRFDKKVFEYVVSELDLEKILSFYPEQTSGGQQQRTAIARALTPQPSLIIADEPTGNLDERSTESVINAMKNLVLELKTSLLVATHSQYLANNMQKSLVLKSGNLEPLG